MTKFICGLLITISLFSCKKSAEGIIQKSIEAHGGSHFENVHVAFTFRGMDYQIKRKGSQYTYTRSQKDSLNNEIQDILDNGSFQRLINGQVVSLEDSMVAKYKESVNSVAYFFQLPYGLQDAAVNSEDMGLVQIVGKNYHQVKVWFDQEGGGTDHQDVFMYWFNADNNLLDYLAYSYETSGGGVRFREVTNRYKVGDFVFQDYKNYGYEDENYDLEQMPKDYELGDLPFLSEIKNESCKLLAE